MKKALSLLAFCVCGLAGFAQVRLNKKLVSRMLKDSSFDIAPGVRETDLRYQNAAGRPMAVYILKVDLKRHGLALQAATPFDKDTFCRQTVTGQMRWKSRTGDSAVAGINADFFDMKNGIPREMEWHAGAMLRDTMLPHRGFVGVLKNGRVLIGEKALYEKEKGRLKEALGGDGLLVSHGRALPQPHNSFGLTRHPRTALGVRGRKKMIFVVVDGRQPDYGNGMPLDELALLMRLLGARCAINLDGGGSSTLVIRDPHRDSLVVRNRPSGGRQRAVANSWIVTRKAKD
jgi:exopolysaccharide biosynthesis protein